MIWSRRSTIKRSNAIGALVALALAATGCSQALRQPMPELTGRLALVVSKEQPSGLTDMPIGVHQIPDSSVYVSGHQGAAGIGVLFGPIGLAAAHAAARSTGERKTQDAQTLLRLDIFTATEAALAQELGRRDDGGRFTTRGGSGQASLEIVPYVVVTFIGDDQARPWVVLKTTLKDAAGDEQWKTRYMAGLGDPRQLTGEHGWAASDGAPFREAVDRSLRAAVDVLLRDAAGTLPRGQGRAVKVKGHWVWVKETIEASAEVLDETPEMIVVAPKVMDGMVFAGINILDKRAVAVSPHDD